MSSPQMIRTFGFSLIAWPFAVEAPMPSRSGQLRLARVLGAPRDASPVFGAISGFRLVAVRPPARSANSELCRFFDLPDRSLGRRGPQSSQIDLARQGQH